jgi:hypothetical protein
MDKNQLEKEIKSGHESPQVDAAARLVYRFLLDAVPRLSGRLVSRTTKISPAANSTKSMERCRPLSVTDAADRRNATPHDALA